MTQFGRHEPERPSPRSRSPHRQWPQYKGPPRRNHRKRWRSVLPVMILPVLIGGSVLAGFIGLKVGPSAVGCDIKGNISINTGERIYHVPGQEYYWETRIDSSKGERWFCSEDEARKAGWRKSRS